MKYSPSAAGFYPDDAANIPTDAVEVPNYDALLVAQGEGSVIVPGPGGAPIAVAPTIVPPTIVPSTIAQQAQAMLAAGVTIASTATPALDGTYACDANAQTEMGNMYNLIQRAGGAFPGGLTQLPWPDISNDPAKARVFTAVADFLNFEQAVGDWVLTLKMIVTTGQGTLPSVTVQIP
jgi:hypothetical protein